MSPSSTCFTKIPRERRISFELARKEISADTINFTASGSSVSKGESLLDTVNNILSMKVDMVVMRHSASGAPHFLAKHIPAAIINAGDGINEHPTQACWMLFRSEKNLAHWKAKKWLSSAISCIREWH